MDSAYMVSMLYLAGEMQWENMGVVKRGGAAEASEENLKAAPESGL
jgi:hypothetical protein